MVVSDLDVGRHEVANRRVRAPEHDVLARRLQIVVHELERARTVPPHDRLGVLRLVLELAQIGVDHGQPTAVQRDAALRRLPDQAVDVATVDDDVVRQRVRAPLAPRAELHDVKGRHPVCSHELDGDQAEMMRSRCRHDRMSRARSDHDLRHRGRVGGGHPGARCRQVAVGTGADDDPPGSALVGQGE